ncbi:MAG TPA: hypothetical protein ACFYD6_11180 [Candidatus Brocadiia bacterium]|nr:hypothetical protein [Candidatus Brocadiales bacterium]
MNTIQGESAEYKCPKEGCDWAGFVLYIEGYVPLCPRCGTPGQLLRILGNFDPLWAECVQSNYAKSILSSDELFKLDKVMNLRFMPKSRTVIIAAKRVEALLKKKLPKERFVKAVRVIITEGIEALLTQEKKQKVMIILDNVLATSNGNGDAEIHKIATAARLAMEEKETGIQDHEHPFFRNMFLESILDVGLRML